MRRLSLRDYADYLRERRALRRSGAGSKIVPHLAYRDQTPAERILLGLALSEGAARARRGGKG
jgi:hypothetical protein